MSEQIFETIVTTLNEDGTVHAAPFGVREKEGRLLIAPFRPSASLDNLLREKTAVVNLVDDVRIFAGCLTGRREWPVQPAEKIRGNVLEAALAHKELYLAKVVDDDLRPQLLFEVVHEKNHRPFRGFNRAQAAVVEASVLVSRLHMLSSVKINEELEYLAIAMHKTAGETEWQAWGWLMEKIEFFRAEQDGGNQA